MIETEMFADNRCGQTMESVINFDKKFYSAGNNKIMYKKRNKRKIIRLKCATAFQYSIVK